MNSLLKRFKLCFRSNEKTIKTYRNETFTDLSIQEATDVPSLKQTVYANDSTLYIVLPFFNYCFFQRRKELFTQFIRHISSKPNIKVVVVEAIE